MRRRGAETSGTSLKVQSLSALSESPWGVISTKSEISTSQGARVGEWGDTTSSNILQASYK
jgi:hypothetical protein